MVEQRLIKVGKIAGVFGIKGWLKIFSYTEFRENILDYSPWLLKKQNETKKLTLTDGALHGKSVLAQLAGVDDRDKAAALVGWDIFIAAEQLPEASEGEYYWSDLIGLRVVTTEGVDLGIVDSLLETGANDVLIVKGERERAIPFLQGQSVVEIDLAGGRIVVDWEPEF